MELSSDCLKSMELSTYVSSSKAIKDYVDGTITELSGTYLNRDYDYTAFEVFPTSTIIPAGTVDSYEDLKAVFGWTDSSLSAQNFTGLKYLVDVPVENNIKIFLRGVRTSVDVDIVIDWGDGSDSTIVKDSIGKNVEYTLKSGNTCQYVVSHTYTVPNRKYIVKIYGKDYNCIRGYDSSSPSEKNIISRIFDGDLKIAKCVQNVSSAVGASWKKAIASQRILRVNASYYSDLTNLTNTSNLFFYCENLQEVYWSDVWSNGIIFDASCMFAYCKNLKTLVGFVIPTTFYYQGNSNFRNGITQLFENCINLSADINELLPTHGFSSRFMDTCNIFKNCQSLYGTVNGNVLWNDPTIDWNIRSGYRAFTGCSLSDQVPVSWGGSLSDSIINKMIRQSDISGIMTVETALSSAANSAGINVNNFNTVQEAFNFTLAEPFNTSKTKLTITTIVDNYLFKLPKVFKSTNYTSEKIYVIDWGDNTVEEYSTVTENLQHTYKNAGTYIITFSNHFSNIQFGNGGTTSVIKDISYAKTYKDSEIIVPYEYYGWPLTNIGDRNLSSVLSVGTYASKWSGISSLSLPNCTTLSESTFNQWIYDIKLSAWTVSIPNVKIIPHMCFANCKGLVGDINVDLTNVEKLQNDCFNDCTNLQYLTFKKLQNVEYSVFKWSKNISVDLTENEIIPTMPETQQVFPISGDYRILVPSISADEYKTAVGWSNVADHIVGV